jgi:large subunit ribosomal protein L22
VKTNEREGTRAVLRHSRMSAYKARQVLDLIRGQDVDRAAEILSLADREAAITIGKVLASAVANAVHNDGLDAEDLYVSACYADEGGTLKRWRPRARGRATRIRKRTSHVTLIVSRLPDERIARRRAKATSTGAQRSRRVAGSRRRRAAEAPKEEVVSGAVEPEDAVEVEDLELEEGAVDEVETDDVETDEAEADDEAETEEAEAEAAEADADNADTAEDADAEEQPAGDDDAPAGKKKKKG